MDFIENTFNLCVDDLSKIIDDYEKVLILSHVSHAVHELKIMNFRQSLIQSWFVIEYFINIKCELYLKSDTIRGLEKKLLINRRTSVEYKILVLKDNALIDDLVFTKIDILRRRRNDMVHNIMCSNIDTTSDLDILGLCSSSFEVIKYFIQSEYNLDLGINCGYSLYCL